MLKEAILWLKRNTVDGCAVVISDRQRAPYPEVTGYWIPTLLKVGEVELAENFARFLISIQNPDGSFSLQNTDEKFVFDTGQIIRGWVAIASRLPEVREPMRRACEWIVAGADPATGKFMAPAPGGAWKLGARGEVSEAVHTFIIQPLRDAAEILNAPHIRKAADRALAAYITTLDLTHFDRPNALTHLYAYVQEALIETGQRDLAIQGMKSVAQYQFTNGAVPGYYDVPWVCSTGLAQLARVWYLLGDKTRGDSALNFLRDLQNHTGGFYGSYGPGAEYFPSDELSWAAKFAVDAELTSIEKFFDATVGLYDPTISPSDGRAQAILSACAGAKKVLDAGCGKGRYAALVKQTFPEVEVYGTDISPEMLVAVPKNVHTKIASFQDMPFADGEFDVVYCIEALEHAPNPRTAIAELGRMVRPGGKLVIIDKNVEKLGALEIEKWETWFDKDALCVIMKEFGFDCAVSFLSYNGRPADGLFLCWNGTKAGGEVMPSENKPAPPAGKTLDSNLAPDDWHESITRGTTAQTVADTVQSGIAPLWIEPIIAETAPNETVLELGSGTGELSSHLARLGRVTTLLDFSQDSLTFAAEVYAKLGLKGTFVQGDVLQKLPFEDQSVDVIWSSGLLEHFTDPQIAHIIKESARVAKKRVVSLVPNASSLAYRLGKSAQERSGRWIWGKEDPKLTLRREFENAGLRNIREYSIAPEHGLNFLDAPELANLRKDLSEAFASVPAETLQALNQGYLLVTIGDVEAAVAQDQGQGEPTKRPRRLVCIPNDPLEAYAAEGFTDLTDYFNPDKAFDEVYCVSPLETREYTMYGMQVLPTPVSEIAKRVQELGADCIRAYDLPAGHAACATRVPNVPVICSVHDVNPSRCPGPLPNADYFLAISGAVKKFLLDKGADPARIVSFANRVDMDIFKPVHDEAKREAFQQRFPGKYRILLIGRLAPQKNQETLIRALSLLDKDYVGIFVGKGDTVPYHDLARRLSVDDRCTFVDAVTHAELAEYYSFCDCFCTPSRWEGFGIVFIEALATEAIIVTSDIAPMNEFVKDGETGVLVRDYENPAALAEAIQRAVQDQALRTHLKSNTRRAAEPFSKTRIAARECEIYMAVVQKFADLRALAEGTPLGSAMNAQGR